MSADEARWGGLTTDEERDAFLDAERHFQMRWGSAEWVEMTSYRLARRRRQAIRVPVAEEELAGIKDRLVDLTDEQREDLQEAIRTSEWSWLNRNQSAVNAGGNKSAAAQNQRMPSCMAAIESVIEICSASRSERQGTRRRTSSFWRLYRASAASPFAYSKNLRSISAGVIGYLRRGFYGKE